MLHGVVGDGELAGLPLLAHQDPDFYRERAARLGARGVPPGDPLWAHSGGEPWPRGELGGEAWTEDERAQRAAAAGGQGA